MKCYLTSALFTFGAAALLGLAVGHARADGPAPLPIGPGPVTAPAAAPSPGAPVLVTRPTVPADAPVPAACASAPCDSACLKKVCVPGTEVKVNTRRVYGEACEDFCLPKCSLGGGLKGLFHHKDDCDTGCAAGACGHESCPSCEHHVRERKYLVVRIKKEEEVVNTCSVGYAPEEPKCDHKLFGHKKEADDGACLPPAEGVIPMAPPAKMPPADGKAEKVPAPKEK